MIAQGLVDRLRPRGTARSADRYEAPGARRRTRGRRLGRRGRIALVCGLALVALLVGCWFWFRDSSLVLASHVTVEGESGPDAARIRETLKSAAHTMSTLDVDANKLRSAVAPYPIVKDVEVTTQFPHGMRIHVVEQLAVGAIEAGGRKLAVAPDGTLLHDVVVSRSLPLIPLRVPPGGARVTDANALGAIRLLAAAPHRLRSKISEVTTVSGHGLVAQLRNGPAVYFGVAGCVRGARRRRVDGRRLHRRHRSGTPRRRLERQQLQPDLRRRSDRLWNRSDRHRNRPDRRRNRPDRVRNRPDRDHSGDRHDAHIEHTDRRLTLK
jgi:cell division septal protein FtsQ